MNSTTRTPSASYFIAVPAADEGAMIAGIGHTADEAIADGYRQSQTVPPRVEQDEDGDWLVIQNGGYDDYPIEDQARAAAREHEFVAQPCTAALYLHVEQDGAPRRWGRNADGLQDVQADATNWASLIKLYRACETQADRRHVHALMLERSAFETDEDADYKSPVADLFEREGLISPNSPDDASEL